MGAIKNILFRCLFGLFLCHSIVYRSDAAPHPGSGSSLLVSEKKGLFLLPRGFQVKTMGTDWILSDKTSEFNKLLYVHPQRPNAQLLLQNENLKTELKIEDYAKRWMKDYLNYGFELLGTKIFFHQGSKALVVDLEEKKKSKKLRQILFLKEKKVVVLTCAENSDQFQSLLADCNQFAKSFQWNDFSSPKSF